MPPLFDHNSWTLDKNTSGDNHWYLRRKLNSTLYGGTWDASTVGSTEPVDIIAENEKGAASASLTITVDPDDKVKFQFNYQNQVLSTSIGQAASINLLTHNDPRNNFLQSVDR